MINWNRKLEKVEQIERFPYLPFYSFSYIFRNIKGYRISFALLTIVSICATLLGFGSTFLLSEIISNISEISTDTLLKVYLPVFVLITVVIQVFDYFTRKFGEAFPRIYAEHQSIRALNSLKLLSSYKLLNYSKEKINTIFSKYFNNVESFLADWFWNIPRNLTQLIIIFLILGFQDIRILLANLVFVIFFLAVSFYISSKMAPYVKNESESDLAYRNLYTNFLLNFNTVIKLRILPFANSEITNTLEKRNNFIQKSQTFHASRWFLQLNLFNIIFIFTFFTGVYQVIKGELELGYLLLIKYAFDNLIGVLISFISYYLSFVRQKEDTVIARRELASLLGKYDVTENTKLELMKNEFEELEIRNGICLFDQKNDKVKQIKYPSFSIKKGEKIGIIGESGSGKSTLFGMLMGIIPFQGDYLINSQKLNSGEISKLFTFISSSDPLFNISIYDNLTLGNSVSEEKLKDILDGLTVSSFAKDLSLEIGNQNTNFSAGQLQRLRLARGLLNETPIYLFDEAFNGIDKANLKNIFDFIKLYLKNKTAIFISHDIKELNALAMNRTYMMQDGILKKN